MAGVTVGDEAPDFTLQGIAPATDGGEHTRRSYTLSTLRGRPVVLVFYPADNTSVCTRQLASYTNDIGRFAEVDAEVLAISPQSLDSHETFSDGQGGFAFPLLADEDKSVGERYGILGPLGFYRRSVFVVDAVGRVAYAHRALAGLTYRSTDEIVAALSGR